ncbi:MAG: hypothetical protein Q9179_007011 [Wetmoreana sp. 5 TL-2023]
MYELWAEKLRNRYREFGPVLHHDQRPDAATFFDDIFGKVGRPVTDADVTMILRRWKQHGSLRRLYKKLLHEFDAAHLGEGLELKSILHTSLCDNEDFQTLALQRFDEDFKVLFHHALCLVTVAVILRQLAMSIRWSHEFDQKVVYFVALGAWARVPVKFPDSRLIFPGVETLMDTDTRVECIEVFDFLYGYLLPEFIPVRNFDTWTAICWNANAIRTERPEGSFRTALSHHIYPSDIADLIEHIAVKKDWHYPVDKPAYLAERGYWDIARMVTDIDYDWWGPFQRFPMIRAIGAMPLGTSVTQKSLMDEHWAYFDGRRKLLGSPFLADYCWCDTYRAVSLPAVIPEIGQSDEKKGKDKEEGYETD